MRRGSAHDSPLGTAIHKFISGFLSVVIVLGPANAFAYDDDYAARSSYRPQDYQTNNRSQNNYDPSSQLDRQVKNLNAALWFRQNVGVANSKLDIKPTQVPLEIFKPKIQFQLASASIPKLPAPDLKINQTIQSPTLKAGFLGVIQTMLKGIGSGFLKIGQSIGNIVQRFFTRAEKPGTLSPQQRDVISQYPNLQPTGPNTFTSVGKITYAFGKIWEPGSTFSATDGKLQLVQGVTMESSYGGINDKSGGPLPIRMATVDGNITPVGLDFGRLKPNTVLQVTQPTQVEGFGTIHPGEMTFQGPIKDASNAPIGGRFSVLGVKVDLNRDAADQFGMDTSVALRQANFTLQAGLMRLNSAVLEQGNKRLFIQESKPPLDLTKIESTFDSTKQNLDFIANQSTKAEKDFSHAAVASQSLLSNINQASGQRDLDPFVEPPELATLRNETKQLTALSESIDQHMRTGDYQAVADKLPELAIKSEVLKARSDAMAARAEIAKEFFSATRDLTKGLARVGNVVDMGEVKSSRIPSWKQVAKGFNRFPASEKKDFAAKAGEAQKSLLTLANAGAIDPAKALDWALALKITENKILAAGPSQFGDRLKLVAKYPQSTLKEAAGEAADLYVFNHLAGLVDSSPKIMEAVGRAGYSFSVGAKALGKASGVGLMLTFPITTVAAFISGFVVDEGLQLAGVNEDLSGFLGMTVGAVVGTGVANTGKVSAIESAWARRIGATRTVPQAFADVKDGMKNLPQWTRNTLESEAGHLYTGGLSKSGMTPKAPQPGAVSNPQKPWGNEDPFAYFMKEVEKLDVSTKPNQAIFYSGENGVSGVKNRVLAEKFAEETGKVTLEMTPGGNWLNQMDLNGINSPLTPDQSLLVWSRLSERYAGQVSGEITLFVTGSRPDRVFYTTEFPNLKLNKRVHKWEYR